MTGEAGRASRPWRRLWSGLSSQAVESRAIFAGRFVPRPDDEPAEPRNRSGAAAPDSVPAFAEAVAEFEWGAVHPRSVKRLISFAGRFWGPWSTWRASLWSDRVTASISSRT